MPDDEMITVIVKYKIAALLNLFQRPVKVHLLIHIYANSFPALDPFPFPFLRKYFLESFAIYYSSDK